MFMLCYKNGGLAREKVRDAINAKAGEKVKPSADQIAFANLMQGIHF